MLMQLQQCHLGVAFYGWLAADQVTLEDLLLINYEERISCAKKPHSFALGKAEKFGNLHSHFPKNVQL